VLVGWLGDSEKKNRRRFEVKIRGVEVNIIVVFKFIAKHPAMALIVGGILFVLIGALLDPVIPETSNILLGWAPWLFGAGIILQILWIIFFRRV